MNRKRTKLIKDEIMSILKLGYGSPSEKIKILKSRRVVDSSVRRLACRAVRITDRRFNDFVGFAAFLTVMKLIASMLGMAILNNTINEAGKRISQKIISNVDNLSKADPNSTYSEHLINSIKMEMNNLNNILAREKSYLSGRVLNAWNKIKNVK